MRAVTVNPAEAVFEAFWDPDLSELDAYTFTPNPAARATLQQGWCWVALQWEHGAPDERIAILRRALDIDIGGYDALRFFGTYPGGTSLTVRAVVDGQEVTVIDAAAGQDAFAEKEGPVRGRKLKGIALEFKALTAGPGFAGLSWLGLVDRAREQEMLSSRSAYTAEWPGWVLAQEEIKSEHPELGLFFDGEGLEEIRRRARQGWLASVMENLRANVQEHLEREPERDIGEYVQDGIPHFSKPKDHLRLGFAVPALECAFVGLVDQDRALLRMAGRYLMAMAHTTHWCDGWMVNFPGGRFHHRSFIEYVHAQAAALGLDWAGAALTERAKRLLVDSISRKALARINQDMLEFEYIHHCNQGLAFSLGRVLGTLALMSVWPRAKAWLELAEKDLLEMLDYYIGEDGGTKEGPGYWGYTFGNALPALAALARWRKVPLAEYVPEKLRRTTDYILAIQSTSGPAGSTVPFSDGGGSVGHGVASLFLSATGDQRWANLLSALSGPPQGPAAIHTLIWAPEELPPPAPLLPQFSHLPTTGIVSSCRDTPKGPIRFLFLGAPAHPLHDHEDKGSFVIEAFGEGLAIDRGMMRYDHPQSMLAGQATYHNLLTPERPDGRVPHQPIAPPQAFLPEVERQGDAFSIRIDLTEAWPGLVCRCLRTVHSPAADLFLIVDEVEMKAAAPATFHLHSLLPMHPEGDAWLVEGQRAVLRVVPLAPVSLRGQASEDGINTQEKPVWHLRLQALAAPSHCLITALQVCAAGAPAEEGYCYTLAPEGNRLSVRRGELRFEVALQGRARA